MTRSVLRKCVTLAGVAVTLLGAKVAFAQSTLPDVVTIPLTGPGVPASRDFAVTTSTFRCGGQKALEFEVLTANIGAQDWLRPRTVDGSAWRMPQIYEYTLYQLQQVGTDPNTGLPIYDYVVVDMRRKGTICIQDDAGRGNLFQCIQQHGPRFDCGPTYGRQGVSVGWADSYFRGLTGQYSCIMGLTGTFVLKIELDPDLVLNPADDTLVDAERDATHDNNIVFVDFDYDGTGATIANIVVTYGGGFDPAGVCPAP